MTTPVLINSRATTDGGLEFFDGTQTLFIIPLAAGTFEFGSNGDGMDIRIWGDTAEASMLWDESEDSLVFNNADVYIGDNDNISFGDSQDLVMQWTTGATAYFDLLPAAANSQINMGSSGYPLNVKHEGNVTYRRPVTTTSSGAAGGKITLTAASNRIQFISSVSDGAYNVVLPPGTSDADGAIFYITNLNAAGGSSGVFWVYDGSTAGTVVSKLEIDEMGMYICSGAVWSGLVGGPST